MDNEPATKQIDNILQKHGGWKADMLRKIRAIVTQADPKIIEEVKWKMKTRPEGLPVWSHNGIVCFAEIWKDNVKLLFPKGADIKDNQSLFNARLKSSAIRAIEYHEGDAIDEAALKSLVKEAINLTA